MALSPLEDDGTWFRWASGVALGLIFSVFAHVYSKIEGLRKDTEQQTADAVRRIEVQLEKLREEMAGDRRLAAQTQQTIAGTMVTRTELDRQIDRIVSALGRGGASFRNSIGPNG